MQKPNLSTQIDRIARLRRITPPSIAPGSISVARNVTELRSDRNVVLDRDFEELVAFRGRAGIALEIDENFDRRKGWVSGQVHDALASLSSILLGMPERRVTPSDHSEG